eukprot:13626527-Alexandrium_andersonii.AAC.3
MARGGVRARREGETSGLSPKACSKSRRARSGGSEGKWKKTEVPPLRASGFHRETQPRGDRGDWHPVPRRKLKPRGPPQKDEGRSEKEQLLATDRSQCRCEGRARVVDPPN